MRGDREAPAAARILRSATRLDTSAPAPPPPPAARRPPGGSTRADRRTRRPPRPRAGRVVGRLGRRRAPVRGGRDRCAASPCSAGASPTARTGPRGRALAIGLVGYGSVSLAAAPHLHQGMKSFTPSAALLWLTFYPFVIACVVLLARSRAARFDAGLVVDGLIGGVTFAAVVAEVGPAAAARPHPPAGARHRRRRDLGRLRPGGARRDGGMRGPGRVARTARAAGCSSPEAVVLAAADAALALPRHRGGRRPARRLAPDARPGRGGADGDRGDRALGRRRAPRPAGPVVGFTAVFALIAVTLQALDLVGAANQVATVLSVLVLLAVAMRVSLSFRRLRESEQLRDALRRRRGAAAAGAEPDAARRGRRAGADRRGAARRHRPGAHRDAALARPPAALGRARRARGGRRGSAAGRATRSRSPWSAPAG